MLVPLLLDRVRVKERPEVFLVFRLDRAEQTAYLFCLEADIIERGVRWNMLDDVWDDRGQPGSFCKPCPLGPVSGAPFFSSVSPKQSW